MTDMTNEETTNTEPTNPMNPKIWPSIMYEDARAAIDYLETTFGFTATIVVPNETDDTIVEHCQMLGPEGGGIMLGTANRPGNEFSRRVTGQASIYVVTTSPDELFDRAVSAGADVFQPLEDQDYGSRSFSIKDFEGNLWSFGTYTGEAA